MFRKVPPDPAPVASPDCDDTPAGMCCDVMNSAPVNGEKSTNMAPIAFSSAVSEPAGYGDVDA